jgi:hypothetical protein
MSGPYEHNFSMFGSSEYAIKDVDLAPLVYRQVGVNKFPRALENTMGYGIHQSGWTDCIKALSRIDSVFPIDDFVEQTFFARQAWFFHDRPFVGFFHYPPDDDLPSFVHPEHDIRYGEMFKTAAWKRSAPHLAVAFTLSEHLAKWLSTKISAPVVALKHPTNVSVRPWDPSAFRKNPRIVQVGAFYRDTRAIYRLDLPTQKIRLLDLRYDWISQWDKYIADNYCPYILTDEVFHIDRVSSGDYDELFASSIIQTKYLALSASNVVVECIARGTPLLVGKTPPVLEYLGADYPLYEQPGHENESQLFERALQAHKYLLGMDKHWLSHEGFVGGVTAQLRKIGAVRSAVSPV